MRLPSTWPSVACRECDQITRHHRLRRTGIHPASGAGLTSIHWQGRSSRSHRRLRSRGSAMCLVSRTWGGISASSLSANWASPSDRVADIQADSPAAGRNDGPLHGIVEVDDMRRGRKRYSPVVLVTPASARLQLAGQQAVHRRSCRARWGVRAKVVESVRKSTLILNCRARAGRSDGVTIGERVRAIRSGRTGSTRQSVSRRDAKGLLPHARLAAAPWRIAQESRQPPRRPGQRGLAPARIRDTRHGFGGHG